MHKSGQTPLLRAKHIEKQYNIPSLYLKLEGSNPNGSKLDRQIEAMLKAIQGKGYQGILVQGSKKYLQTVAYYADQHEMKVFIPEQKRGIKNLDYEAFGILPIATTRPLLSFAKNNALYYLPESGLSPYITEIALQGLIAEVLFRRPDTSHIWLQLKEGLTLKSAYQSALQLWLNGDIEKMPIFHCGVTQERYDYINATLPHLPKTDLLKDTLTRTYATLHGITETMMRDTMKLMRQHEHISMSKTNSLAMAAFLSDPQSHQEGNHVVILNDGKSDVIIEEIIDEKAFNLEMLVNQTREFLTPYHDSDEEMRDAILNAKEKGFIFKATQKEQLQGICIVVHTGFDHFIPSYHLAYIGVKKGNAGRGLATTLMSEAIEKTGGNLSLHVDIPNKRAKKLYEKMGFVHKYDRMIYSGWRDAD